jgi:AcrR family transcriptional regulator
MLLLERDGAAGMTLRKTAALAGVSHAAPAHHFDGLPGLLTAIAARAFATFVAAMQARVAAAPPDPHAQMHATCQGYLDFARAHSGLFHIMFVAPEVNRADPEVLPHSQESYLALRRACLPFSTTGQPDHRLEFAVWSMVHGYATLALGRDTGARPIPASVEFSVCLDLLLAAVPLAPPDSSG